MLQVDLSVVASAFRTALGFRAITFRYVLAAWSGSTRPCSQSRSVPIGMQKRSANASWLRPKACRMTFALGVRCSRLKSPFVSGCASGSDLAASLIAAFCET